ncbi:MAG: STAS domain-containing protein [Candidatus Methylomirabilales bacterium]
MVATTRNQEYKVAMLHLTGVIDLSRMMRVRDAVVHLVGEGYFQIILDWRRVRGLRGKSLELLTTTLCRLRRFEGDIVLLGLSQELVATFQAAGAYAFFEHYDDEAEAWRWGRLKRMALVG